MYLFKTNDSTTSIESIKDNNKIILNCIKNFKAVCNSDENVWGQLILIFYQHEEIYNIDDSSEEFEKDNIFINLMEEVESSGLIGSIYTRFYGMYDDTISDYLSIRCGISSVNLPTYIEGIYEDEKLRIKESEMTSASGIRGEPYEVTNQINYNQGYKYSDELVSRFASYFGKEYAKSHSHISFVDDEWGKCEMYFLDSKFINDSFDNVKCKYGVNVYILQSGEIVFTTPISKKYGPSNVSFVQSCIDNDKNSRYQDCFLKRMWNNSDYVFACYADLSLINTLKFQINASIKEDITYFYKESIGRLLSFLESYADYIADEYDR